MASRAQAWQHGTRRSRLGVEDGQGLVTTPQRCSRADSAWRRGEAQPCLTRRFGVATGAQFDEGRGVVVVGGCRGRGRSGGHPAVSALETAGPGARHARQRCGMARKRERWDGAGHVRARRGSVQASQHRE